MSFLFKAFGLAFLAVRAPPRTRAPGSLHVGHEPQVSQPSFAGDALGLCCGLAGGAVAAISSRSRCRPKALVSKRGKCVRPAETSSKGTTKTVPKVLVVNLDRSPQRWESAQVEFAREKLQVERFSGTDGKALKPEELKKVATFSARWLCTKGMIGCFLSHRRIWQKMVSEKLPAVVVLEDDVRLVEGFSDKLLKLMDELPEDWEVCLLGAIGNINPDVEPFHMKLYSFCVGGGRPSPGKTRRVSDNVFVPHRPAGTHAYLVSLKGAERLVKELPLACYHVDLTAWSLPNLKLYAAVNQIATQDFEAASTVSKSGAAMTSRFLQWAWTVSGLGAMGKAGGVPNLEWAWKAAMFAIPVPFTGKREKDPEEVAEMLKPPDFGAIISRFNSDVFSQLELERIKEQFKVYQTPGQNEVHKDRLNELLLSLGYVTIEEETLAKIAAEISSYSALDLGEVTHFLQRYAQFETETIRKSFHDFDADASGELSTSEVQAVLEAMGCSPFKGTLQRLIDAVDANGSGTLDFNEFLSLLLVYRQTDGFSHKEIRQMHRSFCRFAMADANNVKKVPHYRLSNALIFEFGAQAAELARQLAKQDQRIMRRGKSLWMMASSTVAKNEGPAGLTFRQFVTWSRRMKEAEINEYVRQFKRFDQSQDGVLDRSEVKQVLKEMGYMPLRSNIQDLFRSVDADGDGTVNLEEYLDLMEYFKRWDGFTSEEAAELLTIFKRHASTDGEISTMQIMDILRASGRTNSLRKTQQLVAKVDVDETHSLDFKEFLRLMRLLREEELGQARQGFLLTLKETLPEGAFAKVDPDDESLFIQRDRLKLALRLLELDAGDAGYAELQRLADRYSKEDRLDFDSFVNLVDELHHSRQAEKKKQASFHDSEVQDIRRQFARIDHDGSGEIDRDEIPRLLKPMGIELKNKDDQRRLMALIADARKWAAESGVDPDDCGKQGTATLRFPVFLFMCRLLQREKEAKALAEEEEEAKVLGFTEAQVKKLHSKFCFWVARMQEESQIADDGKDFNLTLTAEGFQKLCAHMNPRLKEEELEEILAALPALKALPSISRGNEISELSQEEPQEEAEAPAVGEVGFPLFVRSVTWMFCKFPAMQEILKL